MTARQEAVHARQSTGRTHYRHCRKEAVQAGGTTCPLVLLPREHEDLTPCP
jgi:hypothetical protein